MLLINQRNLSMKVINIMSNPSKVVIEVVEEVAEVEASNIISQIKEGTLLISDNSSNLAKNDVLIHKHN
jgi:hypothetical protein